MGGDPIYCNKLATMLHPDNANQDRNKRNEDSKKRTNPAHKTAYTVNQWFKTERKTD